MVVWSGILLLVWAVPARANTKILDHLTIIAPASEGGGWDQTARAIQHVLMTSHLVDRVDIINSPGAGGAIALAQFVTAQRGRDNLVLLSGLVMIGAIRSNNATVSLLDATPLARITGEYEVIAVPAASVLQSFEDLIRILKVNPGAISWAGGSAGSTDQVLVSDIARSLEIEPVRFSYVPFSGGGEVASALLSHRVTVGVGGYGELAGRIRSGHLRALAVSSDERLPGVETPTLREKGLEVSVANWRGVFAPPGISHEQRQRLAGVLDAMIKDPGWQQTLRQHYWTDLYLPAQPFARFLATEQARVMADLDPREAGPGARVRLAVAATRERWAPKVALLIVLVVASAAALVVGVWRVRRAAARNRDLTAALDTARENAERWNEVRQGLGTEIDRQFSAWNLTLAEREVALLLLKGLRHKQIAEIRKTKEPTVRQHALNIYRKAGLEGRTDLAAFFLEDMLQPVENPDSTRAVS